MRTIEILFWSNKVFAYLENETRYSPQIGDLLDKCGSQYKPWTDCLSVPRKGDYINVTDKYTELSSVHVVTDVYWHTPVQMVCFIDE